MFVIGRNSSFAYKGRNPALRDVASRLGVRYVHHVRQTDPYEDAELMSRYEDLLREAGLPE